MKIREFKWDMGCMINQWTGDSQMLDYGGRTVINLKLGIWGEAESLRQHIIQMYVIWSQLGVMARAPAVGAKITLLILRL